MQLPVTPSIKLNYDTFCNLWPLYVVAASGPDDDSGLTPAALAARAAEGHLTLQLHSLLTALQAHSTAHSAAAQPCQGSGGGCASALSPSSLLSALHWHTPEGVLEHGYQHDTTEAFEVGAGGMAVVWCECNTLRL